MKTITLTDKEYQLLMSVLEDSESERSNMSCNDPYEYEKDIFTVEERIAMRTKIGDEFQGDLEDEEEDDGFMFNNQYVQYLVEIIK
jgi:hypothetical protein